MNKTMHKTRKLYEVREFIGNAYSKQLGRRLRERKDALRIVRLLEKQGREVYATPIHVTETGPVAAPVIQTKPGKNHSKGERHEFV